MFFLFKIIADANSKINLSPLPQTGADQTSISTILNLVFGILGAVALLVIVLSGVQYITSEGDPQKVKQAKNGILFAAIGIAIVVFAEAIVRFVVNRV